MARLLFFAALAVVACRLLTGRWPWELLQGPSPHNRAVSRARALLDLRGKATRQEIVEAHRRLVARVHPDRGGTNAQMHEANAARDLLLEELDKGG